MVVMDTDRNQPASDDNTHQIIVEACRQIETAETYPSLAQLAKQAGMSPAYFQKLFKSILGVTPKQYANALQRQRVQHNVQQESRIVDAAYAAGFESVARFYARASDMLGMRPSVFKAGGHGVEMDYAIVETVAGKLLVAATEVGVCLVEFGDDEESLLTHLHNQFPAAKKERGRAAFQSTVDTIGQLVVSEASAQDLPLDIQGTAFQQRVWQALIHIPKGETVSYQELARRIGRPNSHRAVANACGANRLAMLIPCHRVVRSDGSLGGYRWGVERKKLLLEAEL